MREFILRSITNKPIIVIERGGEILAELKRHGNNLNQAVRNGYYGMDTEQEIKNCIVSLIVSENSICSGRVNDATFEMQCEQGKTEKRDKIHNRSEEDCDRVGEKFIRRRRLCKTV